MVDQSVDPAHMLRAVLSGIDDAFVLLSGQGELTMLNAAGTEVFSDAQPDAGVGLLERVRSASTFAWEDALGRVYAVRVCPLGSGTAPVVLRLSRRQDYEQLRHTHAEFLQVVSHDLRSPLATIGLAASALASGDLGTLSAGQQAMLGKISNAAEAMARLVENIQAAGRYDPGTGLYEMDLQPVDLLALVQRVVAELVTPPDKAAQRVELALSADIPLIRADAGMLERAIVNLLDNAVKYTPDGGTIRVELNANDSAVTLSVADNGPGIPLADRERVFEKHVRLARAETRRVRGSGLGLFIVRSVAERHGGRALLESEEGKGSIFRLRLPAGGPTVAEGAG